MQKSILTLFCLTLFILSCSDDDDGIIELPDATCSDGIINGDETGIDCGGSCTPCEIGLEVPATYVFERDGNSTVSFGGQTTRILMSEELISEMKDETSSIAIMNAMFAHEEGNDDFSDPDLNASDKNIRGKTAASNDFFSTNATDQALIRADFEGWIATQVNEVYPNWNVTAAAGTAGQLADGSSTRYVTGDGLEMNQVFNKSLIGALMVDQILNNYISANFIDAGTQRDDNNNGVTEDGKPYTAMEHDWDEGYGYAFGTAADLEDPRPTIGDDDSFLNKYIGRVEGDDDFAGIANSIYQAFKTGRAAIVAQDYTERDNQAEILRELISRVIGVRAVYYLQQGKLALDQPVPDYGGGFHDLSEGYGFIYSLQFTRKPNSNDPYFTKAEVDAFLADLMDDGANGLWDVGPDTLDSISEAIAERFSFTVEEAGS